MRSCSWLQTLLGQDILTFFHMPLQPRASSWVHVPMFPEMLDNFFLRQIEQLELLGSSKPGWLLMLLELCLPRAG